MIGDILRQLETDLAWRGPGGRGLGHIAMPREEAERLSAWIIEFYKHYSNLRCTLEVIGSLEEPEQIDEAKVLLRRVLLAARVAIDVTKKIEAIRLQRENERLLAALSAEPVLAGEQREQLMSGFGSILPADTIFNLGWRSALSHVRRTLEQNYPLSE